MKNKIQNDYDGLGIQVNIYSVSMHIPPEWNTEDYKEQFNNVFFVTKGSCSLALDGKVYEVSVNDIIFIPHGSLVHMVRASDDFTLSLRFRFSVEYTEKKGIIPYHTHVDDSKHLTAFYDSMIVIKQENELLFAMKAKAYLLMLLSEIMEGTQKHDKVQLTADTFAPEISAFINSHLSEKLSVETLAEFAGYHPKYFIVLFKKYMNDTPAHFIKKMRLEHSKFLLAHTDTKISEISKLAGFSTQPKFANSFKLYTGYTASEYRKKFHDTKNE